ncbi:MAG: hypothetical protein ACREOI_14260 [bacterium]
MAHICSNCDKIFDHPGKYCSEKCARKVRKFWRQISLASVVGLMAVMFVNYTAPIAGLFSAPCQFLSESGLRQFAAGDSCAICIAKIKSLAKPALPEEFFTWAPASTAVSIAQMVGSYVGLAEAPVN